jgi:hypothetical protein
VFRLQFAVFSQEYNYAKILYFVGIIDFVFLISV